MEPEPEAPGPTRTARSFGLGLVLLCLFSTLAIGVAVKGPCASGDWHDGRQYRRLCYSDVVPLYGTEQLSGGRLPFLDACAEAPGNCDEYPVLTMYAMRLAAYPVDSFPGFFYANALLLSAAAFAVALALYLLGGLRVLWFVLAPTLLIYGFMNWDLLAVALATLATLAYLERRDVAAGVLLGLGAATKLYPALLIVPFVLGRFREREPDRGIHLAWAAAGSWIVVNLPFAVVAPKGWWEFFRFNSARPVDWDSLWYMACRHVGNGVCARVAPIDAVSAALFAGLSVLVFWLRRWREPDFPRWTFAFPLVVLFLLTSKVYSPQYGLWLLPLFALTMPGLRWFVAFELADIAVFVTRFSWFGRYADFGGLPFWSFEAAVLVRAAILAACLVVWVRRGVDVPARTRSGTPEPASPEAALA